MRDVGVAVCIASGWPVLTGSLASFFSEFFFALRSGRPLIHAVQTARKRDRSDGQGTAWALEVHGDPLWTWPELPAWRKPLTDMGVPANAQAAPTLTVPTTTLAADGSSQSAHFYKIVLLCSATLIKVTQDLELTIKRVSKKWQRKGIQIDISRWQPVDRNSEKTAAKTTRAIIESDLVILVESEGGPSIGDALDDAWWALVNSPDKRPLLWFFLGQDNSQNEPLMLPQLGQAHQLTWNYQVFDYEGDVKALVLKELDGIMNLVLRTNSRETHL